MFRRLRLPALLLLGALSSATSADAATPPPWADELRCAALMERMPDMMEFTGRLLEATAMFDADIKRDLPKMKKAIEDARPALILGGQLFRDQAKSAVKAGYADWRRSASESEAKLSADALFDRDYAVARAAYADMKFEVVDERTQAQMETLKADLKQYCKAA